MGTTNKSSRRRFLGNTAAIGALGVVGASQLIRSCSSDPSATTGTVTAPTILGTAIDGQPIRAGVIGCGGRGSGAALDFLNAGPNLSIVAIADVFQDRIDDFRKKLKENKDAVIGLSALLTTTMTNMEDIVSEIRKESKATKVLVGGAPVTTEFCNDIGADFYSPDPQGAVNYLNEIAA